MLNIQIPHLMSEIVNVIASFNEIKDSNAFVEKMELPVGKLIFMYVAQVIYIFSR